MTPGLLERGADIEQGLDDLLTFHDSPSFYLGLRRTLQDDLDGARDVMQDVMESAQRRGDEHTRGFTLLVLIDIERQAGRITAALEHADTARAIVEQMGDPQLLLMHAFMTSAALIDAGRLARRVSWQRRGSRRRTRWVVGRAWRSSEDGSGAPRW